MEVILMVGIPGSGKTTLCKIAFPDHVSISLDKIKKFSLTKKRDMLKQYKINEKFPSDQLSKGRKIEHVMVQDALKNDKNIIIDDTNVTREIREHHINLARKYGATINAVFFQNIQKAYEQNHNREGALGNNILDKYHRDLEPPHEDEGIKFIQIIR